jgi:hypothetical protein
MNTTFQFKISLLNIEPVIWRRIQVPSSYTFWDLHVAIQDAMGWLDYHMHSFILYPYNDSKKIEIGEPDECNKDVILDWEVPLENYFHEGEKIIYRYDYGDDWYHEAIFEGSQQIISLKDYPKCIAGERACPPEDCGGVSGYNKMLRKLKLGKGKEFEEYKHWLKNHGINYFPYKANEFSPEKIKFDDPFERWKIAFGANSDEV